MFFCSSSSYTPATGIILPLPESGDENSTRQLVEVESGSLLHNDSRVTLSDTELPEEVRKIEETTGIAILNISESENRSFTEEDDYWERDSEPIALDSGLMNVFGKAKADPEG